jgi:MFS family permease
MTATTEDVPTTTRFPYGMISALGVSQIVAWGSFYYVFVSARDPISAEFGWTKAQLDGALSVALAVTGLCSYARGRWIDLYGGRRLMIAGAVAGGLLLVGWAQVSEPWQLYAVSAGIGVVSAMTLYEAVFAVVARMLGSDYRRGIIVITLFGGLASTVFVPLTQYLVDEHGWRTALRVLAIVQLPFCAGIPYVLLRGRETPRRWTDVSGAPRSADDQAEPSTGATTSETAASIRPALRHPVFWLLALSFVSYSFMFTSLVFNIVPMLREAGYTTAEAVAAYAVIGPSQLAGRIAVLTLERFLSLTTAGMIGTLFPVGAVAVLATLTPHSSMVFVFAIAFGTGMGIKTIVQATAAPEFLGRAGYGALQGALMVPVMLAQAGTPLLAAWIWQLDGNYDLLETLLLAAAATSAASFLLAARLRPTPSTASR